MLHHVTKMLKSAGISFLLSTSLGVYIRGMCEFCDALGWLYAKFSFQSPKEANSLLRIFLFDMCHIFLPVPELQVQLQHMSIPELNFLGKKTKVGTNATCPSFLQQGGSGAGSESGGSGADSMTGEPNVSGRSSAYGDNVPEGGPGGPLGALLLARSETSSVGLPSNPSMPHETIDPEVAWGLHALRGALLDRLLHFLPQLRTVGGVRAIPFMQVSHTFLVAGSSVS